MKKHIWLAMGVAVLLVFILVIAGYAQDGITNFTGVYVIGTHATATPVFVVNNEAGTNNIVEFQDNGTAVLTINDGGNATLASTVILSTWLRTSIQTPPFTVTHGVPITPTGTFCNLYAAGAVSTDSIVAGTAGDMLILYNSSSATITISDTGTLKISGDTALGQYDSLTLISDGTNWVEIAQANN